MTNLLSILGLAVFMSTVAVYVQKAGTQHMDVTVQRLNLTEGFYTSEMAAWHGYYLGKNGLYPTPSPQANMRQSVQFNNHYLYNTMGGSVNNANNVSSMVSGLIYDGKIDPTNDKLIRRYVNGSVQYEVSANPNSGLHCGYANYATNVSAKTCLKNNCPVTANGVDILFLIDNSESFQSSDPVGVNGMTGRETATLAVFDKIAAEAAPGSRVSLVMFNNSNTSLAYDSWGWFDAVGTSSANSRTSIANALLRTRNPSGRCDVRGALNGARSLFQQVQNDGRKHIIFLVSEGIYDDGDPWAANVVANDLKNNMGVEIVDIHLDSYYMKNQELPYWASCGYPNKAGYIYGCSRPGGGDICNLGNNNPTSTSCTAQTQTYINYMMGRETIERYAGNYANRFSNPAPCRSYVVDWAVWQIGMDLCKFQGWTYSGDGYSMGQRISSNIDASCSTNCAKHSYGIDGWLNGSTNNISETMKRYLNSLCNLTQPPLIPTNVVGVTFEDALINGDDGTGWGTAWLTTDIRACITGDFEVDPVTHRIFSTAKTPQVMTITSEKRPNTGCRHNFIIEVYNSSGVKKYESVPYETQANAPPQSTSITVVQGDEIRVAWEDINSGTYAPVCAFNGRDFNNRLTDSRAQTSGSPNNIPAPKFFYGSCGDWSGRCSGTSWRNSRQDIRSLVNGFYSPTQILNNGDWVGADQATRDKVCQLLGEQVSKSFTTTTNSGTNTVVWNGSSWTKVSVSSNNTRLETITCGCP